MSVFRGSFVVYAGMTVNGCSNKVEKGLTETQWKVPLK